MARPQKFRHQREDLTDPKVAEKLGRFVIEIEDLRAQRSKIDELLAAAYDAVDEGGFEKKFVRKVVSLRAKEEGVRRDEEDGLESYEFAIEKGVSLARTRRKPANDQFDPTTGEFFDDNEASGGSPSAPSSLATREAEESVVPHSPETATQSLANGPCEAVSERTAIQVDASASAEAGVSGQPEMIPATSAESAGEAYCNSTGLPINSHQPLTGGDHEVVSIAECERETVTSNTGEGAANTALPAKPKFVLRPYCRNPGEGCGGSGTTHCHSCLKAREEVAA